MLRTLLVLGFVVFSVGASAQQKPPVNAVAQSMVDFLERVARYLRRLGRPSARRGLQPSQATCSAPRRRRT